MDVRVGLLRKLSTKELMLLNCGVGEDSWESLGLEISPECSLEVLMLKLKLQYFGHLMWRADSFEKTLMVGKIEGRRRDDRGWDGWMASLTQWTWVWVNSKSQWWTGRPGGCSPWGRKESDTTDRLNWTELIHFKQLNFIVFKFVCINLLIFKCKYVPRLIYFKRNTTNLFYKYR